MSVPSMMFVPFLNSLFQGAIWISFLFTTIILYSHVNMTNERVYWNNRIFDFTIMQNSNSFSYVGYFLILFLCLWPLETIHAIGTLVFALTVTQWSWSTSEGVKTVPFDALLWSIYASIRYQLGTVILGSLLMTPVNAVRWIFCIPSKRNHPSLCNENNFSYCCYVYSFFVWIEAVVDFLSDNAYVGTDMTAEPLFSATRHATRLLQRNTGIGEYLIKNDGYVTTLI
ncbi:Choline transporter-like [Trypanosoma melophagium]|uniref:Choline transporter-like n=1 Tax=Trypanosoma melophagium TaxID=715481 RepID=UPI00351A6512|nr:Choline transporter-like [Trypanosoma melophagium]